MTDRDHSAEDTRRANARALRLDKAVDRAVDRMIDELVVTDPRELPRREAPRLRALVRAILAEIL